MVKMLLECQNAFSGRRQILDATLIVHEVIEMRKRSSRLGLVCNLDMEKADAM